MHAKQPRTFKVRGCFIFLLLSPQSRLCRAPSGLKAMEKKSHKDSIRIVITHEDCGNIEIQNNLWYNAINSKNLNLTACKRFLTVFSKVCQSLLIDDF